MPTFAGGTRRISNLRAKILPSYNPYKDFREFTTATIMIPDRPKASVRRGGEQNLLKAQTFFNSRRTTSNPRNCVKSRFDRSKSRRVA